MIVHLVVDLPDEALLSDLILDGCTPMEHNCALSRVLFGTWLDPRVPLKRHVLLIKH